MKRGELTKRLREAARPGQIPGKAKGNVGKAKAAANEYEGAAQAAFNNAITMKRTLKGQVDEQLLEQLWQAGRDAKIAGNNATHAMERFEKLFTQVNRQVS